MKTFKLIVRGKKQNDVELAIAESMRLIGNGNLSGFGKDEDGDGSFSFDREGEYEDEDETTSDRSIAIRPTHFSAVESALYHAGDLDLIVRFTKADPKHQMPFITEVTVGDQYPEDVVERVRNVLVARFPVEEGEGE